MRHSSFVLCAVVLCIASLDSRAQTAPSARASASAEPARVEIPPWPGREIDKLPAFDAEPFPEEASKPATEEDWKSATRVRPSRMSPTLSGCRVWRVREWVKVHCDIKTAAIRLLAGSHEGVTLNVAESIISRKALDENWSFELMTKHFETMGRFGDIVFPVRRGDRRVFEWIRLDIWENYEGGPSVGSTSMMIVEEQWRQGGQPELALLAR